MKMRKKHIQSYKIFRHISLRNRDNDMDDLDEHNWFYGLSYLNIEMNVYDMMAKEINRNDWILVFFNLVVIENFCSSDFQWKYCQFRLWYDSTDNFEKDLVTQFLECIKIWYCKGNYYTFSSSDSECKEFTFIICKVSKCTIEDQVFFYRNSLPEDLVLCKKSIFLSLLRIRFHSGIGEKTDVLMSDLHFRIQSTQSSLKHHISSNARIKSFIPYSPTNGRLQY